MYINPLGHLRPDRRPGGACVRAGVAPSSRQTRRLHRPPCPRRCRPAVAGSCRALRTCCSWVKHNYDDRTRHTLLWYCCAAGCCANHWADIASCGSSASQAAGELNAGRHSCQVSGAPHLLSVRRRLAGLPSSAGVPVGWGGTWAGAAAHASKESCKWQNVLLMAGSVVPVLSGSDRW